MKLSESLLYWLAKKMYSCECGHSEQDKEALKSDEDYAMYRLSLIDRVTAAAEKYGVPIKDQVVLDLGCYDGAVSMGYLDYGAAHLYGVDIDEESVKRAQQNYQSNKAEFLVSGTKGIPLDDNSVNTICCFDVFEHVANVPEMLNEIRRILKPGGKIIIGTWGWKHPFAPHLWSTMPVPYAHVLFSEKTMLRVCKRVYNSDWYQPTLHDVDENGARIEDKYDYEEIPSDYLNKYLILDFERDFNESGLHVSMNPLPFGSKFASWTRIFLNTPWLREYITGYLWVVLTKKQVQSTAQR